MHDLLLLDLVATSKPLVYALIFLGMIFEGEVILLTAIFLVAQGLLALFPVLITVAIGLMIGDTMWYFVGSHLLARIRILNFIIRKLTSPVRTQIERRPAFIIFTSKFASGIHHAILMQAGFMKMDFKKYMKIVSIGNISWIIVMGSLGYFFSASFQVLKHIVRYGEIALLIGVLAFFLIRHIVTRFLELQKDNGN
ncbi:DedA family protein [Candidatus Parcubacteria bacterium]|nr:DedA family protein [Candidatus Parcubacteria bacterium]